MSNKTKQPKKTKPLRGIALAKAAFNQILLHPKTWDQSWWHNECKTKHCFGGWCQILAGYPADEDYAGDQARSALGFGNETNLLFDSNITLVELRALIGALGTKPKDLKPFRD